MDSAKIEDGLFHLRNSAWQGLKDVNEKSRGLVLKESATNLSNSVFKLSLKKTFSAQFKKRRNFNLYMSRHARSGTGISKQLIIIYIYYNNKQLHIGNFTLLVPTNHAFSKLPATDLAAVTNNQQKLTDLIKYHLINGVHYPKQFLFGRHYFFNSTNGHVIRVYRSSVDFQYTSVCYSDSSSLPV